MTAPVILTLSCEDKPGIVARVTGNLYEAGANILEAQQFDDTESGQFFMRVVLDPGSGDETTLRSAFTPVAEQFGMEWTMRDASKKRRTVLMVSKFDHCLGDLLYRTRIGELPMEVVAIIGNHPKEALNITLLGDVPYHHLPIT